jgi:hypothetical protein
MPKAASTQSTITVLHRRRRGRRSSRRKMSAPAPTALISPPSGGGGFDRLEVFDPARGTAGSIAVDDGWVGMANSLISLQES